MSDKRETKLPPLTTLESIKEALDVRLGRRGDPLDRALTIRDLVGSNMPFNLRRIGSNQIGLEYGDRPGAVAMRTPTGFRAQAQFGGINLMWDIPPEYEAVAYTEVYRSTQLSVASRVFLTASGGTMYFDVLDEQDTQTYHYWIRYVSVAGNVGPFAGPVSAAALPLVSDLLERLTGEISESQLAKRLADRIELIDGVGEGSVAARLATQKQELTAADQALAQRVDQAQASLGKDVAAVQVKLEAEVKRVDGELVAMGAAYTAKVQANGLIGGFGVFNDGTTVDAAFDVDRFWIGRTNSNRRKPFIIDDGNVYMDTALIRSGTIQEGQLGAITIGKLKKNDGTPITTVAGLIRADALDADNLTVAEAATFYGDVQSGNFNASRGWRLLQNGYAEFMGGRFNGTVEVTGGTLADDVSIAGIDSLRLIRERAYAGSLAKSRADSWTRPTSTLIDGNKIFTGDAYVDTLQIKGQAVTIPESVAAGSAIPMDGREILSCDIAAYGANVMVMASFSVLGTNDSISTVQILRNGNVVLQRSVQGRFFSIAGHVGGTSGGVDTYSMRAWGVGDAAGRSLGLLATRR